MSTELLPFLTGLSRDSGGPVNDPSSFGDLRNIVFFEGSLRLRAGLGNAVAELSAPAVCAVDVFKAYGLLVWVLYNPAGRTVTVIQTNLQGQSETAVGSWGVLSTGAESPPRFTMAEAFGILTLAHDEPNVAARLETYRFDPADGTPWQVVSADLDGAGSAPVKFRGVRTHLGGIWAWGYGTASAPDRPELMRRSNPDDPTVYQPEWYFRVGVRLDPIVAAIEIGSGVGSSLLVFKGSSWFRIDGSTSADFDVVSVDPIVGCVSCKSLLNVNGTVYWWSPFGPKQTTGTGTADLSQPLDLTGPLPEGLPTFGPPAYAYVYFDPDSLSLGFAFPDPTADAVPVWKLSLNGSPRWSLDVLGRGVMCAVLAVTGQGAFLIDPGYADPVSVSGSAGGGSASALISWTNVACVGDETVEIWFSMNAGPWTLGASVPVNTLTVPQTYTLTHALLTDGTIDVSLRHKRQNRYLPAYTTIDPSTWPAVSQASGTIVLIATPVFTVNSYNPVTTEIDLQWTMATASAEIDAEITPLEAEINNTYGISPILVPGGGDLSRTATYAPGTLSVLSTTLGPVDTAFFKANEWEASSLLTNDFLTASRSRGYYLRLRLRGRIGVINGDWTAPVTVYIGYPNLPAFGVCSWQLSSVALGSKVTLVWVDSSDASGATTVRTIITDAEGASPPNGGSCSGTTPSAADRNTLMDTTGVSPQVVPVGTCATCLITGQVVISTFTHLRQRITKGGFTHWTTIPNYSSNGFTGCGP